MKAKMIAMMSLAMLCASGLKAQTNDFYDKAETIKLKVPTIEILGEIANPGKRNLDELPLRSVIVKETRLQKDSDKFVGAYRYDGYSLYDILNQSVIKKKNEAEFPSIIDLYVVVENDKGEKVVFSWGEIYYPVHRHEILIATQVARIVPSKTKELWPLPSSSKLVVASDLLTHRNILNPTKIIVKSYSGNYEIRQNLSPMNSMSFLISDKGRNLGTINDLPADLQKLTYPAVFYGRGRGIHGTTPFSGILLKELIAKYVKSDERRLKTGLVEIAGKDGYHASFSFSEIMNRNDQDEFLVIEKGKEADGGAFQIFPANDFFSDRAIKSVESIKLENVE
ncbi:MAG: hypothetical protein Q8908_02705 [Bacteroidota bacterium]|nr:hypothetical protein [Bacteroidota bacterium]